MCFMLLNHLQYVFFQVSIGKLLLLHIVRDSYLRLQTVIYLLILWILLYNKWLGDAGCISVNKALSCVFSSPNCNKYLMWDSLRIAAKKVFCLSLWSRADWPSSYDDKIWTMKTLREISCTWLLWKITFTYLKNQVPWWIVPKKEKKEYDFS